MTEAMKEAFRLKAREVIAGTPDQPLDVPRIGLEVEMAVVKDGLPGSASVFLDLDFVDTELGASQIELRTDPVDMEDPRQLLVHLEGREAQLRTHANGVQPVRIGAIPNLAVADIQVTNKEKYHIVPAFHDSRRGEHINTHVGGVNFNQAAAVGLFSSTQINMQANGLEDAVDKMNRSLMISPSLVALSGNARIIDGKDTGINDIRMLGWHVSHDIRTADQLRRGEETRIGTPNRYFDSINDYFTRIAKRPFILDAPEAAFEIGIGLNWLDTRIKFIGGRPIVEYRAMSVQPSAKEDVGMTLFYLGRLTYSQRVQEPLMDMGLVHQNRDSAMRDGLKGKLYSGGKLVDATLAVENELHQAELGLEMLGYQKSEVQEYFGVLRARISSRKAPADEFAERCLSMPVEEALMKYAL
jgi:hypothetical protein